MRQHFHQILEEIRTEVIRMGTCANDLVKQAVDAIINGNVEEAHSVIRGDDEVDHMEQNLHQRTVLTVMQEAPVATDLRFLISTLGVVGEIEKAADDAVKLSRRARKLSGQFPSEMKVALLELGEEARKMFAASLRLYAEYSPELATEIIESDESVDTQYSHARDRVIEIIQAYPENTAHLVRTIEAFHALEHVADHAVEIAKRMKMLYEPVVAVGT
ncbi:MAG: phosphate transport system regulatory protein PhoU [Armatimonadetes bacterium 55-13]|nr:phosphate signaling complex protein PhoU [Armatimonadota bacterium]OJU64247.1 MAG: phosphate transport system regulatory protein PhoU [Armatimonadetes bacterium 55-13]